MNDRPVLFEDAFYIILDYLEPFPYYLTLRQVNSNFLRIISHVVRSAEKLDLLSLQNMTPTYAHLNVKSLLSLRLDQDKKVVPYKTITIWATHLQIFVNALQEVEQTITTNDKNIDKDLLTGTLLSLYMSLKQRSRDEKPLDTTLLTEKLILVYSKSLYQQAESYFFKTISKRLQDVVIVGSPSFDRFIRTMVETRSSSQYSTVYIDCIGLHLPNADNQISYTLKSLSLAKCSQLLSEYNLIGSSAIAQLPIFDKMSISEVGTSPLLHGHLQQNFRHYILSYLKFMQESFAADASCERNFKKLYEKWYFSKKILRMKRDITFFATCVTQADTHTFAIVEARKLDEQIESKRRNSLAKCKIECSWFALINTNMKKNLALRKALCLEHNKRIKGN